MRLNFRDFDRLEHILEVIGHIRRRLSGVSEAQFLSDIDEIDLAAFRLSIIGEAVNKLDEDVKARHPHIDWAAIYAMRNVIAHDYQSIKAQRVWDAAQIDLDPLARACRAELNQD